MIIVMYLCTACGTTKSTTKICESPCTGCGRNQVSLLEGEVLFTVIDLLTGSQSSLLHALAAEETNIPQAVIRQILNGVHCNDLVTPLKLLTNEHRKTSHKSHMHKNYYSLYRDLLFLSFVALGRENIDHGKFFCAHDFNT